MKKIIVFLFLISALSAELTRLPSEFHVVERFFSLTATFDISTDVLPFAVARKRLLSFTNCFDLEDLNQLPLATADSHFFSWGTVADVTDPLGNKIGWIEEEIFRIIPWAEYRVFNRFNQLVAIARMNFWGTDFELFHPDFPTEIYATISRPFFRFLRDYWTVQIKNFQIFEQGIIDPRLLVILAIFQTDKENRDRTRKEIIDQLRQEQDYQETHRLEY